MARSKDRDRIGRIWRCVQMVQSVCPLKDTDDPELPAEIMEVATGLPDPEPSDWLRTVLHFNRLERELRSAVPNEDERIEKALSLLPPDDAKRVGSTLYVQRTLFRDEGPLSLDRHGDQMEIYRVAAALFNKLLADAQADGERLNEKRTTPVAVQKTVSRYPDPDSV